jgi:hypothetical protein
VKNKPKQFLLSMAAQRLGRENLATRLDSSDSLLTAWMSGRASMPDSKFLTLAALVDELDPAGAAS